MEKNLSPGHFPVEAVAKPGLISTSTAAAAAVGQVHGQRLLDGQAGQLGVAEEVTADARKHLAAEVEKIKMVKEYRVRFSAQRHL